MKLSHASAAALFLGVVGFQAPLCAALGDLDPAFGSGGIARISIPRASFSTKINASALQADGKSLIAGEAATPGSGLPMPVVGRVNRDGTIDPTFGRNGWVVIDVSSSYGLGARATAITPTATGGFLVAFGRENFSPSVARVRADGTIDRDFAQGSPYHFLQLWNASGDITGIAETPDGGLVVATSDTIFRFDSRGEYMNFGQNGSTRITAAGVGIRALRLRADGSILVAGWMSAIGPYDLQSRDMMVAKLTPTGAFDVNFGTGGKVVADLLFFTRDEACVIQEDAQGRLLIGGMGAGFGRAALVRMDPVSGARDLSFGILGVARSPIISTDPAVQIAAIQVASNGADLLVAGYATGDGSSTRSLLGRVDATGQFVSTFGNNGVVVGPPNSAYGAVGDAYLGLATSDAGPVAIGSRGTMSETWTVQSTSLAQRFDESSGASSGDALTSQVTDPAFGIALKALVLPDGSTLTVGSYGKSARIMRMLPGGALDTAFGEGGHVDFQYTGYPTAGRAIAVDASGNIVLASLVMESAYPTWRWSVTRWTPDGFLDRSFTDSLSNPYFIEAEIGGIAVQDDGKVVISGTGDGQMVVVRLNADGWADGSFNGGSAMSYVGSPSVPFGMALQPDGAIIAGGMYTGDPTSPRIQLVRFTASGSRDYGFMDFQGPYFGSMVAASVSRQDDGKILVGGSCFSYSSQGSSGCVARVTAEGAPDYAFGSGGFVPEIAGAGSNVTGAFGVANGKILAGGDLPGGYPFVARIRSDGMIDAQYAAGGVAQTFAVQSPEWSPNRVSADSTVRLLGYASAAAADEVLLVQFQGGFEADGEPNAFSFPDAVGVPVDTLITSAPITISGINVAVPISVEQGEYSIGCNGIFTSAPGTVVNGDTVCLRVRSATSGNSDWPARLTVGSFVAEWNIWTGELPETTITSSPAAQSGSQSATFAFSASTAATFACSLDGAAFSPCTSPVTYGGLAEGEHRFQVYAIDAIGADNTPAAKTWRVDLTPPDTTIASAPADKDREYDRADFTFVSNESGASFECSLDGGAFAACASPLSYVNLPKGKHTFAVRARDLAGNLDATPATWEWKSK